MLNAEIINEVKAELALLGRAPTALDIAAALRSCGQVVSDHTVLLVQETVRRDSVGAGALDPLLALPGVTDILVNGPRDVYIDRGAGLERAEVHFADDEEVRKLATRLAASAGRRLDDGSPYVDTRLASGVRVHAVLGTIASPGTCLSLRVPSSRRLTLDDWVSCGSLPASGRALLSRIVERRRAFLVSGGTGSGKTTLLNSLLGLVPPSERIVIVEDSREMNPGHPHVVRLEARPVNAEGVGLVTLADLVRQSLRMRPDRLVIGEVRGAELCDLLMALNTGHEGGCGTVHANSVEDVPARLESLAALGGFGRDAVHAQVAAALSLVIHVARRGSRRLVTQIGVLRRGDDGHVVAETAWGYDGDRCFDGPAADRLRELVA
ncbi:MAG: TadA family conjugal transfer-associated ATPase [Propionibacteriaceae bacterium]|jgi:pilus assembly protein CpaF|nr:TadA family conjugal transfer-associated ATPase [Propionibacteriaceae bacterium]